MPDNQTTIPSFSSLSWEIDSIRHVATVCLQREEEENRLNAVLISELTQALHLLSDNALIRVLVLKSKGKSFCAGVDLEWMINGAIENAENNLQMAGQLGGLFKAIYDCPYPTVAQIEGAATGAGLALICACDLAFSGHDSIFYSREVQLGILPALMSPYVISSIGPRMAYRLFFTGCELSAVTAKEWGLLHDFVSRSKLTDYVNGVVDEILLGMPASNKATKQLIRAVSGRAITHDVVKDTVSRIAELRATDEAIAALRSAQLGTSPPSWRRYEFT
ncbi:enoyl-CoA hydratase-related protein [bacterium]|nr:enoyl-CoA hydratase-related protein [bacterium]